MKIRIKESDLNRIIRESVDRVINEISDLTKLSALNKNYQDEKYKYSNNRDNRTPFEKERRRRQVNRIYKSFNDDAKEKYGIDFDTDNDESSDNYEKVKSHLNHELDKAYLKGNADYLDDKQLRGYNRYNDFVNGEYQYKKGEGWRRNK